MFKIYLFLVFIVAMACGKEEAGSSVSSSSSSNVKAGNNNTNVASNITQYYSCERSYVGNPICSQYSQKEGLDVQAIRQSCETGSGTFSMASCNTSLYPQLCSDAQLVDAVTVFSKGYINGICARPILATPRVSPNVVIRPIDLHYVSETDTSQTAYKPGVPVNTAQYFRVTLPIDDASSSSTNGSNYTISMVVPNGGAGSLEVLDTVETPINSSFASVSNLVGNPVLNFTTTTTRSYIIKATLTKGSGAITVNAKKTPLLILNELKQDTFTSADTDVWYVFKAEASINNVLVVRMPLITSNYDVFVYNTNNEIVASGVNSMGVNEDISIASNANTFYTVQLHKVEAGTVAVGATIPPVEFYIQQGTASATNASISSVGQSKTYYTNLLNDTLYNIRLLITNLPSEASFKSSINYNMCLYTETGATAIVCSNRVASNPINNELITYQPSTSGLYKIVITRLGTTTGQYSLSIVPSNLSVNSSAQGRITGQDVELWHAVSLQSSIAYRFNLVSSANTINNDITLYTCTQIVSSITTTLSNCTQVASSTASGPLEELYHTPASSGVYYIKVSRISASGGSYVVSVKNTVLSLGVLQLDNFDSTASEIYKDYKVVLTAGTLYNVTLSVPTQADFDLALLNSSSTQVASASNGTGINETISHTPASNGTYTVRIIQKARTVQNGVATPGLFFVSVSTAVLNNAIITDTFDNLTTSRSYDLTIGANDLNKRSIIHLTSQSYLANFDLRLTDTSTPPNILQASETAGIGVNEGISYVFNSAGSYKIEVLKTLTPYDLAEDGTTSEIEGSKPFALWGQRATTDTPLSLDTVVSKTVDSGTVDVWYETPVLDNLGKRYVLSLTSATGADFDVDIYSNNGTTALWSGADRVATNNESIWFKPSNNEKHKIRVRKRIGITGSFKLLLKERNIITNIPSSSTFLANETEQWYRVSSLAVNTAYLLSVSPTVASNLELSIYSEDRTTLASGNGTEGLKSTSIDTVLNGRNRSVLYVPATPDALIRIVQKAGSQTPFSMVFSNTVVPPLTTEAIKTDSTASTFNRLMGQSLKELALHKTRLLQMVLNGESKDLEYKTTCSLAQTRDAIAKILNILDTRLNFPSNGSTDLLNSTKYIRDILARHRLLEYLNAGISFGNTDFDGYFTYSANQGPYKGLPLGTSIEDKIRESGDVQMRDIIEGYLAQLTPFKNDANYSAHIMAVKEMKTILNANTCPFFYPLSEAHIDNGDFQVSRGLFSTYIGYSAREAASDPNLSTIKAYYRTIKYATQEQNITSIEALAPVNSSFSTEDTSHWYQVSSSLKAFELRLEPGASATSNANFDLYLYKSENGSLSKVAMSTKRGKVPDSLLYALSSGVTDFVSTLVAAGIDSSISNYNGLATKYYLQVVKVSGSGDYTIKTTTPIGLNKSYIPVTSEELVPAKYFNSQITSRYHTFWMDANKIHKITLKMEPKCAKLDCIGYIQPPSDYDIFLYKESFSQDNCSYDLTNEATKPLMAKDPTITPIATAQAQPGLNETISYLPTTSGCFTAKVVLAQQVLAWDYKFLVEHLSQDSTISNKQFLVNEEAIYQAYLDGDVAYNFELRAKDSTANFSMQLLEMRSNSLIPVANQSTNGQLSPNKVLSFSPRGSGTFFVKVTRLSGGPTNAGLYFYFRETPELTIFTKTYRSFNVSKLGEIITNNLTPNLISQPEIIGQLFAGPVIITHENSTISDFLDAEDSVKWFRIYFTQDNLDFDDATAGLSVTYSFALTQPAYSDFEMELYEEGPFGDTNVTNSLYLVRDNGVRNQPSNKEYSFKYTPPELPAKQERWFKAKITRKSILGGRFSFRYYD